MYYVFLLVFICTLHVHSKNIHECNALNLLCMVDRKETYHIISMQSLQEIVFIRIATTRKYTLDHTIGANLPT